MLVAMIRWQRLARVLVGVVAAAVLVAVALGLRKRQPDSTPSVESRTDLSATVESTGALIVQAKGAQQDFRIEADRQLTYPDGLSRLENMKITALRHGGRDFVITGRHGEMRDGEGVMRFTGAVRVAAAGIEVVAERALYRHEQGVFEISGPLQFAVGQFTGNGRGATYRSERDRLEIHDDAHVRGEEGSDIDIRSRTAVLAGQDDIFRFEGAVVVRHGDATANTEAAVAYLSGEEQRVDRLELRGDARVASTAGTHALRDMAADNIDLSYGEDGRTIRKALLVGAASLHLASTPDRPLRHIAAERVDVTLAPDGVTVSELAARQQVLVELPEDGDTPTRRIRAAAMNGFGDEARGLHTIRFRGGVEFEETSPGIAGARSEERTVAAAGLEVEVGANLSEIEVANFSDDVTIRDADLTAAAPTARYDVRAGSLDLDGAATSDVRPHLDDRRGWLEARRIQVSFGQATRTVAADEDVKSVLNRRADGNEDGASPATTRVPGLLAADQPVNVTAARLQYDESTAVATYSGAAKLWQGQRAVQGETVVVDERTGDLTATGAARSQMILEQIDPETNVPKKVDSVATAEELVYEDALRRATYTTNAHAVGPQGDITADRIELYFVETQDALDRAEAYTQAELRLERRSASGERLTYFAADGRYVMSGAPVRIIEDLETECRQTTGRSLTFYQTADAISVDGNNEHRTQTKAGGSCPGLPRP